MAEWLGGLVALPCRLCGQKITLRKSKNPKSQTTKCKPKIQTNTIKCERNPRPLTSVLRCIVRCCQYLYLLLLLYLGEYLLLSKIPNPQSKYRVQGPGIGVHWT